MIHRTFLSKHIVIGFLTFALAFISLSPSCYADDPAITADQLIAMLTTTLRGRPKVVVDEYINKRGVDFFPTKSVIEAIKQELESKLTDEHMYENVVDAIISTTTKHMRFKVCQFETDDATVATKLVDDLIHFLSRAKEESIRPFGYVPLDDKPCPAEGFSDTFKPEPKTFYFLIKGSIKKDGTSYQLRPQVVFRDPQGIQYALPGADSVPERLSKNTSEETAHALIKWAIETSQKYADH